MGSSIQVTETGTVYKGPCKLIGVIVDPGSGNGSFTLRDGGASGTPIAGCTKCIANQMAYSIAIDHDCRIDLHATISSCILYCVIR